MKIKFKIDGINYEGTLEKVYKLDYWPDLDVSAYGTTTFHDDKKVWIEDSDGENELPFEASKVVNQNIRELEKTILAPTS